MNRLLFVLCLYIFCSISFEGNSQVRFTHYSTLNGLPNDFVLSMVQDDNGFIWFGTHVGIVRFDGHSFNLFQPDPQKSSSLSHKHISHMHIDLYGNLWIKFTANTLNRMDTQTGKFYNYLADTTKSGSISSLRIGPFFEDHDSILWIPTKSGLNRYNNKEDNFYSVLPKSITSESYPSDNILSVTDDTLGNLWFLSAKGIGRINQKDLEMKPLGQLVHGIEIDSIEITSMVSDRKSKLWFATMNNGVFCYDIVAGQLTNCLNNITNIQSLFCDKQGNLFVYSNVGNTLYYFDQQDIHNGAISKYFLFRTTEYVRYLKFIEDKRGNIWISSSHGLNMFSEKSGIIHYKHDPLQRQSLSSNIINFTFVDQTNNLWVCNYRRGVDKADLNQKPFKGNFTNPDQTNNVFLGTNITSVMEDSQNFLWVGGNGKAVIRFDRKSNTFNTVQLRESDHTTFSALYEDSEGDIWVGNYYQGIYRINPKTLKVTYSNTISESSDIKEIIRGIRQFVEDKEMNIWFASSNGVHKWERKTGKIIPYSALYDKHDPNHGFYRTIFIDKKGTLWSGSYNGGLACYNTKENKVKRYLNIPGDKTSISGNGVYCIFEESDSTFLIGTTMGLNRFNRINEQFSLVKTNKSLYNYSIYAIIPDLLNNYWMTTDNGLICLNKITLECTFFNESDGLLANEFNTTASYICKDSAIYLGSPKGLLSFNPKDFTTNPYPARPTITNLQISNATITPGDTLNGRVVLTKQIWSSSELVLKYYENDFTLQFSAMHFAVPENNKFWYMLEGYKDEWIATDANRRWATFTGLQPGEYTFRLKATNNDGVVCKPEEEVSLNIEILPPFWRTIWFKLLIIFLIAALVGIYIRIRILRFKRLNTLLEQKVRERTYELQEINISLEEKQEEIYSQKEELTLQKASLEETNKVLRTTQEKIIAQNKELDIHRNKLESLIKARTSELIEALKKAEESNRLKNSFLANMSHEIRTPMNAIIGFSSLLQETNVKDSSKKDYIDIIIKSSQSLLVIIDDILDLSKIQSNQLDLNLQPQSLILILNEMYNMFRIEALNKEIELRLNVEKIKNDLTIVTDEVRLKQVISNLLSNALKFTNKGTVEFGVYEVSEQLTIYVNDTGIGIPEKFGDAIFEHFLKLEEDKDNLFRGAGLGLAISKSLVNLLGGSIWYQSKEKQGTTFYFTHPLDQQQIVLPSEKKGEQPILSNLKGITILIAEDEESNYRLLLTYLNNTGAIIHRAKNGKEACSMVDSNNIDLILMDLKMPVLGGIEASKLIKQKYPKIPIIAQTAYTPENQKDLLNNKVFDNIISKPFNRLKLLMAIAEFV